MSYKHGIIKNGGDLKVQLSEKGLGRDELAGLKLRGLFEKRGFRRVRVNKFEDYALYVENKNFLNSESMITFLDPNGKLLALKPDVTLSVVRSVPKNELQVIEKLYYADEVCRLSRENREYKVHSQVGVEMIGRLDGFSNIEAVDMALSSLDVIGGDFVLDVSHLGFVYGMLEQLELEHTAMKQTLSAIHMKSAHDAAAALEQAGVNDTDKNRILILCDPNGEFEESLLSAKSLISCERMYDAYAELERLYDSFKNSPHGKRIKLDFSVVNDLDYYSGLIFRGYVKGLPKVVLTGGRYDNLMRKMGKRSRAVGFAVSLDDIGAYIKPEKSFDYDVLITYRDNCDYEALLSAVKTFEEQGLSARLENEDSRIENAGFTWEKQYRFLNKDLLEVKPC